MATILGVVRLEEHVGLLTDGVPAWLHASRAAGTAAIPGVGPDRHRLVAIAVAVNGRARDIAAVVAGEDPGTERVVEVRPDVRNLEVAERQRRGILAVAWDGAGARIETGRHRGIHHRFGRDALRGAAWDRAGCGLRHGLRLRDPALRAPVPDEVVPDFRLACRPGTRPGRRIGVEAAVMEGHVENAVVGDRHEREELVSSVTLLRAERRIATNAFGEAPAIAVRRSIGAVVVDPGWSDPGAPAICRFVEEDVRVRIPDRAVAVVGQRDVDVIGELPAALIGDDRVEDGVVAETAVRRDRPRPALAAGRTVGSAVDAPREVDVIERVHARGWREGLAAVG